MMIAILHVHSSVEQPDECVMIGRRRYVEHGHRVAALRRHALEQRHVAFHAGDEHRLERRLQPKLVQSAQAVGIAVEDVELGHGRRGTESLGRTCHPARNGGHPGCAMN
jgi:hypothetical protein